MGTPEGSGSGGNANEDLKDGAASHNQETDTENKEPAPASN